MKIGANALFALLTATIFSVSVMKAYATDEAQGIAAVSKTTEKSYIHVSPDDSVLAATKHPAFEGFGHFILPTDGRRIDGNMKLNDINSLLPYHNHIDTKTTVDVINYMIDEV